MAIISTLVIGILGKMIAYENGGHGEIGVIFIYYLNIAYRIYKLPYGV